MRSSAARASTSDHTVRLAKRTCASACFWRSRAYAVRRSYSVADHSGRLISSIASGSPRSNVSRPSCGRSNNCDRGDADRFEAAQPLRQRGRHIRCAHTFRSRRFRQQQARLEIGEPRRHHQIVGREFEPHPPRCFDEREILVGEREDRDFGEIDFLLAREVEQQVERTFKTFNVDDQRLLTRRSIGRCSWIEGNDFSVHARLTCGAPACASCCAKAARACATSNGFGCRRAASAVSARSRAAPFSSGALAATSRISFILPLQ